MYWKLLRQKTSFAKRSKILLYSRSAHALSCILLVLSDKLSPESGSSGASIFTSLLMIFNKFAVMYLTWLCLMVINPPFLHDKACSKLIFCPHSQFSGSRCKCHLYLILIVSPISYILHEPGTTKKKESYRGPRSLINFIEFFLHSIFWLYLIFDDFGCFEVVEINFWVVFVSFFSACNHWSQMVCQ